MKATRHGYGTAWDGSKTVTATRLSYAVFTGDPGTLDVCHSCDIPECVNPYHLWLGDAKANVRDSMAKGRKPKPGPTRGDNKMAHIRKEDVGRVRGAIANRSGSLRELSKELGISLHVLRDLSCGRHY